MDYKKFESVFEKFPSLEDINYTLAVLTPRKIDNGHVAMYLPLTIFNGVII